MHSKVVITGLGTVSAYGLTTRQFWKGLVSGDEAISELDMGPGLKMKKGYVLKEYHPAHHFDSGNLPLLDRFSQFAIIAAREAVEDSRLDKQALDRTAVVIGSGNGGKHTDEEGFYRLYKQGNPRVHPYMIPKGMHSAVASNVSLHAGAKGPTFAVSSACASGAHAIIQGVMMVQLGVVDCAIVGGSDAPFSYGILKAWDALRVVTNDEIRPFSKDRSGIILGDGAGVMVIESEAHARKRGTKIYAAIEGFGMSSDAGHITHPDLGGIKRAIEQAHINSGLAKEEVQYINAHGTGTPVNDVTEARAINDIYKENAKQILVSASKPLHGHALGAASSMEVISTVLTLKEGLIPPTVNITEMDPDCRLNVVADEPVRAEIEVAVTNSFAFGGLNAVLILSRYP